MSAETDRWEQAICDASSLEGKHFAANKLKDARNMDKKLCNKCKRNFSLELINPMITNCGKVQDVCPICALEIRNKIHGLPADTPFTGGLAQAYYAQALEEIKQQ